MQARKYWILYILKRHWVNSSAVCVCTQAELHDIILTQLHKLLMSAIIKQSVWHQTLLLDVKHYFRWILWGFFSFFTKLVISKPFEAWAIKKVFFYVKHFHDVKEQMNTISTSVFDAISIKCKLQMSWPIVIQPTHIWFCLM